MTTPSIYSKYHTECAYNGDCKGINDAIDDGCKVVDESLGITKIGDLITIETNLGKLIEKLNKSQQCDACSNILLYAASKKNIYKGIIQKLINLIEENTDYCSIMNIFTYVIASEPNNSIISLAIDNANVDIVEVLLGSIGKYVDNSNKSINDKNKSIANRKSLEDLLIKIKPMIEKATEKIKSTSESSDALTKIINKLNDQYKNIDTAIKNINAKYFPVSTVMRSMSGFKVPSIPNMFGKTPSSTSTGPPLTSTGTPPTSTGGKRSQKQQGNKKSKKQQGGKRSKKQQGGKRSKKQQRGKKSRKQHR